MTDTETTTVHVGIGNSDDKLSQGKWAAFVEELREVAHPYAAPFVGVWHSAPAEPWQNCQMAWDMYSTDLPALRADLAALRDRYGQDSIALCAGTTEFI